MLCTLLKMDKGGAHKGGLRTRKLMTINMALYLTDDIDRLYVSRKEGGRGLVRGLCRCINSRTQGIQQKKKV